MSIFLVKFSGTWGNGGLPGPLYEYISGLILRYMEDYRGLPGPPYEYISGLILRYMEEQGFAGSAI